MKIGKKLRSLEGGRVAFRCPGCNELHQIRVEGTEHPVWTYNGNPDKPTFKPSVKVTTGHYVRGEQHAGWCEKSGGTDECDCVCCHSFVTDGWIQFLGDCTHELKGQMVELPDIEDDKGE